MSILLEEEGRRPLPMFLRFNFSLSLALSDSEELLKPIKKAENN
jgi:hypothetical protein